MGFQNVPESDISLVTEQEQREVEIVLRALLLLSLAVPTISFASLITLKSDKLFITSQIVARYSDGGSDYLAASYSGPLVSTRTGVSMNYTDDGDRSFAGAATLADEGVLENQRDGTSEYEVAFETYAENGSGQGFQSGLPPNYRDGDVDVFAYGTAQTIFRVDGEGADFRGYVVNHVGFEPSESFGRVMLKDLTADRIVLALNDGQGNPELGETVPLQSGHLYKAVVTASNGSGQDEELYSGFYTTSTAVSVPEPGPAILFAIGSLGLFSVRSRRDIQRRAARQRLTS